MLHAVRWVRRVLPLLVLLLLVGAGSAVPPVAAQTGSGNAGLVIAYGPGQVTEYCFSVPAAGVSGLDLLQRAGVPVRTDTVSLGAEICAINGVGCLDPGQPCYCQCQGEPCVFWQYSHWQGDHWVGSILGASDFLVHPGMIEGWAWGGKPPAPAGNARCALPVATTTPHPASATSTSWPSTSTPHPVTATPRPATATPRPASTTTPTGTENSAATPLADTTANPTGATNRAATPTSTLLPTDTAAPSETPTALPTDTIPPTVTATLEATPTAIVSPTVPAQPTSGPNGPAATYAIFAVLAAALLGLILWARRTR